ncbi:MAG: hypothetical protein GOU99_01870 [Candidatus Altiarchaeota archaeon]|nr:hypothetical protein [Candidatus Altiarchaeota archaeon]
MDALILGASPVAALLAFDLSAQGVETALLSENMDSWPELVSPETVEDAGIPASSIITEIEQTAVFKQDRRIEETPLKAFVIDTEKLSRHYLKRAAKYGAEILVGCTFDGQTARVENKQIKIEPKLIIDTIARNGPGVKVAELINLPFNKDSFEVHAGSYLMPATDSVIVGSSQSILSAISWHRFELSSIVRTGILRTPNNGPVISGNQLKLGRAAGQVMQAGWEFEPAHVFEKLLGSLIPQFFEKRTSLDAYSRLASKPIQTIENIFKLRLPL